MARSLVVLIAARQAEVLRAPHGCDAQQGTWKLPLEARSLIFPGLPVLQKLAMGSAKEAENQLLI